MEQPKRRKIAKAAAGIFTLALSFFFLTVAFYMDLMSITETERLQSQSEIFDPAKEADGRLKELTIQGLSYEFAKDFKGTDWYCFGFSETGQIRIIVLNEDHFRALEDHTAYLFSDSPSGLPDPDVLFGMAVPLEEDIRQFGLEALRYLLAQPDMTEEEFSAVVGTSVLDTTRLPAATEFFGIGTFLLAAAFVLFFQRPFCSCQCLRRARFLLGQYFKGQYLQGRLLWESVPAPQSIFPKRDFGRGAWFSDRRMYLAAAGFLRHYLRHRRAAAAELYVYRLSVVIRHDQ